MGVSDPGVRSLGTLSKSVGSVAALPVDERAAVLAELRQAIAALPAGPSEPRTRLVALARRLEAAQAQDAQRAAGGAA